MSKAADMPTISLRQATILDWMFVASVSEACMRKYCEQTWGSWQPDPVDTFQPDIHQIIQRDGKEIGCIAIIEDPTAITLKTLYILPGYQQSGIGAILLQQLIERARTSAKPIQLRVLRVNPARRFYERHGFVVTHSTEERHFMSLSAPST